MVVVVVCSRCVVSDLDPMCHSLFDSRLVTCALHYLMSAGDGSIATIPYSEGTPDFAKAHAWPSMEYYGQVIAYIDVERRDPPYLPPAIPDIDSGAMVFRGVHK